MKFLKKFGNSFHTRAGAYVFFALAAAAAIFLRSSSWAYGWIAELYPLGENFVPAAFILIGLCAAYNFYFLLAVEKAQNCPPRRVIHVVTCVLTGALFVYTLILLFGFDKGFDAFAMRHGFSYFAQ